MFKKSVLAVFALTFFCVPFFARASEILLTPSQLTVTVGDEFQIFYSVNPDGNEPFTVKADSLFTSRVISIEKWAFANGWVPNRAPQFDYFSNEEGRLLRTATYVPGVAPLTTMGTATFKALMPGEAVISLTSNSFVTDVNGNSSFEGANPVVVKVLPVPVGASVTDPKVKPISDLPKANIPLNTNQFTFDLSLELPQSSFSVGEKVATIVHLVNLSEYQGALQVPVNYRITNEKGDIVSEETGIATITETSSKSVYSPTLKLLPAGTYKISAEILSKNLSRPARSEGMFTVNENKVAPEAPAQVIWYITALVILVFILMWLVVRKYVIK
jgi:hypothetical protein